MAEKTKKPSSKAAAKPAAKPGDSFAAKLAKAKSAEAPAKKKSAHAEAPEEAKPAKKAPVRRKKAVEQVEPAVAAPEAPAAPPAPPEPSAPRFPNGGSHGGMEDARGMPPAPRFMKPNWQKRSAPAFGGNFASSFGNGQTQVRPAHAHAPVHPAASAPAPVQPQRQQQPQQPRPQHAPRPQQAQPQAPVQSQSQSQAQAQPAAAPAVQPPPAPRPPPPPEVFEEFTGILEFGRKEHAEGRLRQLDGTYLADALDPVVGTHLIEKYNLRPGLKLKVTLGKPFGGGGPPPQHHGKKDKGRGGRDALRIDPAAKRVRDIVDVEGLPPETWAQGRQFDKLTIVMPEPRLALEYPGCPPACRFIDLFCPIGKGTRGMIVSPPKAGKTTLLQQIATALHKNHPQIEVYALLIDERPEEVTDFRRNVPVTVWASSNDHPPEKHVGLSIAAIERCKRLAEMGKDVVVLLDSLTRLGRAFNVAPNIIGTGKTLSGGLDAGALGVPKQLFGAARRFEEGGSLTIIATALVDTGSRGDQVIFEEFKGTGNMELILDRRIAEQRLFPAMDLAASGTRNDQKLMSKHELDTVTALRRRLLNMPPPQQVEQLLKAVERYKTNSDLVGDPNSVAKA